LRGRRDGRCDGHRDGDPHFRDGCSNSDTNFDRHKHPDPHADTDPHTDAAANPLPNADAQTGDCCDGHADAGAAHSHATAFRRRRWGRRWGRRRR
jgi:hypothetical protein